MGTVQIDGHVTLTEAAMADREPVQLGAHLKVKRYDPDKSSYGPRLTKAEWDSFRPLLTQLHHRGLPRHKVIEIARDQHGFGGTYAALHKRFKEWGLTSTKDSASAVTAATLNKSSASDDSNHLVDDSEPPADVECQLDRDEASFAQEASARGHDFARRMSVWALPDSESNSSSSTMLQYSATIASRSVSEDGQSEKSGTSGLLNIVQDIFVSVLSPTKSNPQKQRFADRDSIAIADQAPARQDSNTANLDFLTGVGASLGSKATDGVLHVPAHAIDRNATALTDVVVHSGANPTANHVQLDESVTNNVVEQAVTLDEILFAATKRSRSLLSSIGSSRFSGSSDAQSFIRLAKRLRSRTARSDLSSLVRWSKDSTVSSLEFGVVTGLNTDMEPVEDAMITTGHAYADMARETSNLVPRDENDPARISHPRLSPGQDKPQVSEYVVPSDHRNTPKAKMIVQTDEGWALEDYFAKYHFDNIIRLLVDRALREQYQHTSLRYRIAESAIIIRYTEAGAKIRRQLYETHNLDFFEAELPLMIDLRFVVIDRAQLVKEQDSIICPWRTVNGD